MQAGLAAHGVYILQSSWLLWDELAAASALHSPPAEAILFPLPGCSRSVGQDKAKRFLHPPTYWRPTASLKSEAHSFIYLDDAESFCSCSSVPPAPFQTNQFFIYPKQQPLLSGTNFSRTVSSVRMLALMLWFYYSCFSFSI